MQTKIWGLSPVQILWKDGKTEMECDRNEPFDGEDIRKKA